MTEETKRPIDSDGLLRLIGQVRRRWRLKVALRGAVWVVAGSLLVLVLSAWMLEALRFSAAAIAGARVLFLLALAGLVAWFLARPLSRRVTDEQVALYLEEHEPALDAALVSAVDASREGARAGAASPALTRRLIESAVARCHALEAGWRADAPALRRSGAGLAAVALGMAALLGLGPDYLRHAASALLRVSGSLAAATPYRIHVDPGHATIARGADQTIVALLDGFDADHTELVVRRAGDAAVERIAMIPGAAGSFETMLFDVGGPLDYFVESTGVRSPTFTLSVVDLPYVQRLELEYHFPSYTGLAPRTVAYGGDIAVLRGTEVRLRAHPTIDTPGGEIRLEGAAPIALARQADGTLTGSFTVEQDGLYRLALDAPRGERVDASPRYTIDVLEDMPPAVVFSRPARDVRATPLEEVFVETRATDDYGVRQVQLVYSVNGGPEQTIELFGGRRGALTEITAGHTFYLEELQLRPGDFVSYYARATDNDTAGGGKQATSDLFFMMVRPFGQEVQPADSQAGGGGGGGGDVGALSQRQREIITATFNVLRDRSATPDDQHRENVVFVALAQQRLREQVEGLSRRMSSQLVRPEPEFAPIAELLPQAAAEMRAAEEQLQAQQPGEALAPAQRALQHLLKAEEQYELQVAAGGGGGGGGAGSISEDLAELFQTELDRLASQYETFRRADQLEADQQVDELVERLRELARRQEQEAERQRRRAASGRAEQGGGASQRALAEQVDEAARRLERLSREEGRTDLMDSARRLQEAADAMRRAAAGGDTAETGQAAGALDRLREVEEQLRRGQAARAERDIADALRRAQELTREQRDIAAEVQTLGPPGRERQAQTRALGERKEALEARVADLERQLDRTASEIRAEQREASRRVQGAAEAIRDDRLKEKIRYSRGIIRSSTPEYMQAFEDEITESLEGLQAALRSAQSALGRPEGDTMAEALDEAGRLARGVESLGERMRERAEGGGEPGSEADGQAGGEPGTEAGDAGGQAGAPGAAGDGLGPDAGGRWTGLGGWGFTGEDIRQFRGEVRQWTADLEALRDRLSAEGLAPGELEEIVRALGAMDAERAFQNRAELERLQRFVEEGLKQFEYGLRRQADLDRQPLFLSGAEEVPDGFRALVEEYYRSLSGRRQ